VGSNDRGDPLGQRGKALLVALLLAWVVMFSAGAVVSTASCRASFLTPSELSAIPAILCGLVVLLCYTPTSVAFLAAISGVLGALGRIARLSPQHTNPANDDNTHPYLSGAVRGFFVYLATISGVLVVSDDPFTNPTAAQYLRIAGLVSLFSFMVSYNPGLFGRMLKRAGSLLEDPPGPK
jgi:hypothetical protein